MECCTARQFELALDIGEKGKGISPVAPVSFAVYQARQAVARGLEAESGVFVMMARYQCAVSNKSSGLCKVQNYISSKNACSPMRR